MMDILPALSPKDEERLRESIRDLGVLTPVLLDRNTGEVVDGRNRKRIAEELGIQYATIRKSFIDDDARLEAALTINEHRRAHLTKKERDRLVNQLRAERGWSDHRIARALGVHHTTVGRSTGADAPVGEKRTGQDGRKRPAHRATKAEVTRRKETAAQLWREGYTRDAIADALGVSHGTVTQDVAGAGIDTGVPRETKRGPAPSASWRDDPAQQRPRARKASKQVERVVGQEPAYRRSIVLDLVETTRATLHADSAENRLAWDATEAEAANDEQWMSQARATLGAAIGQLQRLQRVLDDPAERKRQRETTNDSLVQQAPHLRVVGSAG